MNLKFWKKSSENESAYVGPLFDPEPPSTVDMVVRVTLDCVSSSDGRRWVELGSLCSELLKVADDFDAQGASYDSALVRDIAALLSGEPVAVNPGEQPGPLFVGTVTEQETPADPHAWIGVTL